MANKAGQMVPSLMEPIYGPKGLCNTQGVLETWPKNFWAYAASKF